MNNHDERERKIKVLFLCTGNSCRSQMAEGFARRYGGEQIEVFSAGISPAGVNPRAVEVMGEAGVDISGQSSTGIDPGVLAAADLVITLCGDARDSCPVVPSGAQKRHWPLEDPAGATGTEAEILDKFRFVRDEIDRRVWRLIEELKLQV